MTVLHLYALVEPPLDGLPSHGAFGEPLLRIDAGAFLAVAGAVEEQGLDEAAALAHARVVESVAAAAETLLPSRFGVRFGDDSSLCAAVESRRADLQEAVERVRGCAEFALRAVFSEPEEREPPGSGREYLERRAGTVRLLDALVAEVHRPLERLARAARAEQRLSPPTFGASYLVPREGHDAFAAEAARRVDAVPGVTAVCVGPWPPYSFAEEAA